MWPLRAVGGLLWAVGAAAASEGGWRPVPCAARVCALCGAPLPCADPGAALPCPAWPPQEPTTQSLFVECFDRDYLNAKVGLAGLGNAVIAGRLGGGVLEDAGLFVCVVVVVVGP